MVVMRPFASFLSACVCTGVFALLPLVAQETTTSVPPPAAGARTVDEAAIEARLSEARRKVADDLAAADELVLSAFAAAIDGVRAGRLLSSEGAASLRGLLWEERAAFQTSHVLPTSEGMRVAAASHRMAVDFARSELVAFYAVAEAEARSIGASEFASDLAKRRRLVDGSSTEELYRIVAGWSVARVGAAATPEGEEEKESQGLAAKNWATARPGDPLGWGASIGRFTYGFYTGVSVSKEKEDFSKLDYFLRFRSDLTYESTLDHEAIAGAKSRSWYLDPNDLHTWLDLAFAGLPAKATDEDDGQQFFESKKSFVGALGVDWRLLQWSPIENHTLVLAPSAFGSLQTFTDAIDAQNELADLRSGVTTRWGTGLRVMGIPGRTEGDTRHPNPLPRHFIGIYFGDDEAVGHHRLMIDSALILDEGTGFFVGFGASMGRGEDDVRVVFGFATTLHNVFTALNGLVPDVLK